MSVYLFFQSTEISLIRGIIFLNSEKNLEGILKESLFYLELTGQMQYLLFFNSSYCPHEFFGMLIDLYIFA